MRIKQRPTPLTLITLLTRLTLLTPLTLLTSNLCETTGDNLSNSLIRTTDLCLNQQLLTTSSVSAVLYIYMENC